MNETVRNVDDGNFDDLFDITNGVQNIPAYIIVYVIIFACASFLGTVGNILVIVTMMLSKALRNTRNAFIVSLAVADLMVSGVTMPASIIGVLLGKKWYDQRLTLCAFTSAVCAPGCVASMHSIAWIAISRYYYIAKYPKFMVYFTKKRIAIYITSIWILGYGVHLPNELGWGKTRYSFMLRYCTLDTDLYSYALFYASVLLLAIVLAFVFYLRIYLVLRRSTLSKTMIVGRKQDQGNAANQSHNKWNSSISDEIKIVKTSFKIFILFLITWSPICLLFLIHAGDLVPPWVYLYAGLTAHANSTLNFFVYFVENDMFRKALRDAIKKGFKIQQTTVHVIGSKSFQTNFSGRPPTPTNLRTTPA